MLYHGPVRVPENARPGTATIRVSLSPVSTRLSIPTDIEVTLTGAK